MERKRSNEGTQQQALAKGLDDLSEYTERGLALALQAIELLRTTVNAASTGLNKLIERLRAGDYRGQEVMQSLANQLDNIRVGYELLPERMRNEVDALSGGTFSITLFGRTTAGKSTLMTVLTHGDGSRIGNGAQRTTLDVRTYKYRGLEVTDVPGIAAFGGEEDETLAFETAKQGDLILFLITDDAPQRSEAEFLSRIKMLGKPIICLVNVKAGVNSNGHISQDDYDDLCDDVQDKFDDVEGLQAIRRSLVDYGPQYGQDWEHMPFAFVHLKAAYLAQQPEYASWSSNLYWLSRFDGAIHLIEQEVRDKGGFYRFKTYADAVSVPLVDVLEMLFGQSVKNSVQGRTLIQKRRKHDAWVDDFEKRAHARIDTLLAGIADDLKREASSFAEDNYDNKNAAHEWKQIVERCDIQGRANTLLSEFERECEDELRDIGREIEFDLKIGQYRLSTSEIKGHAVVDARRVWNWSSIIVSGGLTIAGLFIAPELLAGGVIAGVAGAVGGLVFDDFGQRKKKACQNLEQQLNDSIDETMGQIKKKIDKVLEEKIVEQQLRPTSRKIDDVVSSLFDLSATQRKLARKINKQQGILSKEIISEALAFLGYSGQDDKIVRVARIPGNTTMLVLGDGSKLPYNLKRDLRQLLNENVRYVFDSDDERILLSRAIGQTCKRKDIHIEEVKGEPLIAHIQKLDSLGNEAQTGIRLGEQITELLITK